jgi:hypothetical protein
MNDVAEMTSAQEEEDSLGLATLTSSAVLLIQDWSLAAVVLTGATLAVSVARWLWKSCVSRWRRMETAKDALPPSPRDKDALPPPPRGEDALPPPPPPRDEDEGV